MALDIPTPWLRGPDTLGAVSSGASAGLGAARNLQAAESDSARLGLEATRLRQSAMLESARLNQAAEQSQMEFQARQKLAEQNQLREQQRLNIENAYKTAQLGIAKGRLEQTEAMAAEKARTAAATFQREQAFAADVASGIPVMEAYRRNPVSPSLLSSVNRSQESDKPIHVGESIVQRDPETGEWKEAYRAPESQRLMKVGNTLVRPNPSGNVDVIYSAPTKSSGSDLASRIVLGKGGGPQKYSSKEDVVKAFKSGSITRAEAAKILKEQFNVAE